MTMHIGVEDAIVVNLGVNKNIKFTRCVNGPYYFYNSDIGHVETPQDDITDDDKTEKSKSSVTVYSFVSSFAANKEMT